MHLMYQRVTCENDDDYDDYGDDDGDYGDYDDDDHIHDPGHVTFIRYK